MQSYLSSQLGNHCYYILLEEGDFSNQECNSLALSKFLGISIVFGSSLVKLPQLITILVANSTKGLSQFTLFAELLAFIFTWSYSAHENFPFTTWGESMFLTLQNFCIILLSYIYARNYLLLILFPLLLGSTLSLLLSDQLPPHIYFYLQSSVIPLAIFGKLKQIQENYSNSSTGQLSLITTSLLLLGTIIRIFTTLKETGDSLSLLIYILSAILNFILLSQILWYWERKSINADKKTE